MSRERWDVVLQFNTGPLSFQGDQVLRGPVVRIGANPGAGGLRLEGYRGIDDRQAVISAYDGGSVSIAPVGTNQVRVAAHANVDWAEVQVLTNPVYLSPGDAFHLGPIGRGVTATFVEARRLGVWEQRAILSEAADAEPDLSESKVANLDTSAGRPWWFLPGLTAIAMVFTVAILATTLPDLLGDVEQLGPTDQGLAYYDRADLAVVPPLSEELQQGINEAFHDFVMQPNATYGRWPDLAARPENWDPELLVWVGRSVAIHARSRAFWHRLEVIRRDYAYVVEQLRDADLPEVLAAIPYQETRYTGGLQSVVCAKGWWQFMPETALRAGLQVKDCKMSGAEFLFTPKQQVPPFGVVRNAEYVSRGENGAPRCRIQSCAVDERTDLVASTEAAITLLEEVFDDQELADSGAVVQIAILSHNAGYDDARFDARRNSRATNLLPAYRTHLKNTGRQADPFFYGSNITCQGEDFVEDPLSSSRCGGVLPNQTQHYGYSIIAQHMMAVCYYALNYGAEPPFDRWRKYKTGYCADIDVPTKEQAAGWAG